MYDQHCPLGRKTSTRWLLSFLLLEQIVTFVLADSYDCSIEKQDGHDICVFRNVVFFKNTSQIAFYSPGPSKPERVAFVDSHMDGIPPNFLTAFANDLKVLKVENCMLKSLTITRNLKEVYASNNYIEKIFMARNSNCDSLTKMDISSNRLVNVRNITSCENLEHLDLSGNENLWEQSTFDMSLLGKMTKLKYLNVAGTGILYIENSRITVLTLLETIDLSKNDILPVDFRLEIFNPFTALETLKLNDNNMQSIDYAYLLDIKSLKTVYLNGNSFQCMKIREMLNFLHQHSIDTPPDRHSNCEQHEREFDGMCCTGPMPTSPRPPTTVKPGEQGEPQAENQHEVTGNDDQRGQTGNGATQEDSRVDNGGEGGGSLLWLIVVPVFVAGAGGFVWYRRQHRHHH